MAENLEKNEHQEVTNKKYVRVRKRRKGKSDLKNKVFLIVGIALGAILAGFLAIFIVNNAINLVA